MALQKPIFLVGEARGEHEQRIGSSFVGPSGVELLRMSNEAGLLHLTPEDHMDISKFYKHGSPLHIESIWQRHPEVYRTNVFNQHPPSNRLEFFCGGKAEGIPGYPALIPSKYCRKEFQYELDRLGDEILAHDPNLIVALGNSALWALCGRTGVTKLRGTTQYTSHCVSDFKLLPTYHPTAVLRQWELRPVTIIDLAKVAREALYPDIRRPACEIWIEPAIPDIKRFIDAHIRGCPLLSVDIETAGNRITCIGFATSKSLAIVIPFDDERAKGGSYWPTTADERQCWDLVRGVLEDTSIPKLFQNGLYDIAFLLRAYGIGVRGAGHDSMLLHHALQPESLKGLAFLGSVYTDHGAWKSERKGPTSTIKRDA